MPYFFMDIALPGESAEDTACFSVCWILATNIAQLSLGECLAPLTYRSSHSVTFGVYEAPDLGEVAVPLRHILNAGGLHQQGVVGGQHSLDPLITVLNQGALLPAAHKRPHFLVGGDLRFLSREKKSTPTSRRVLKNRWPKAIPHPRGSNKKGDTLSVGQEPDCEAALQEAEKSTIHYRRQRGDTLISMEDKETLSDGCHARGPLLDFGLGGKNMSINNACLATH